MVGAFGFISVCLHAHQPIRSSTSFHGCPSTNFYLTCRFFFYSILFSFHIWYAYSPQYAVQMTTMFVTLDNSRVFVRWKWGDELKLVFHKHMLFCKDSIQVIRPERRVRCTRLIDFSSVWCIKLNTKVRESSAIYQLVEQWTAIAQLIFSLWITMVFCRFVLPVTRGTETAITNCFFWNAVDIKPETGKTNRNN